MTFLVCYNGTFQLCAYTQSALKQNFDKKPRDDQPLRRPLVSHQAQGAVRAGASEVVEVEVAQFP